MAVNSTKLESTILCPKTNSYSKVDECKSCVYHEGSYSNWITECWYGVEFFDLALLRIQWDVPSQRATLPKVCRPLDVPSCKQCYKFATKKCDARIRRGYKYD
jgi:hypothetical protein